MSLLSRLAVAASKGYGLLAGASTNVSADYLVVAGGGSGGQSVGYSEASGGGGAGGYRTSTTTLSTLTTYTVTVGAGGAGATTYGTLNKGSDSVFNLITSTGGGGGQADGSGQAGGSGGGGGAGSINRGGGAGNTPSTSPSQGNNGGTGFGSATASQRSGGGGGGAGAVGANATASTGGAGGAGSASSISGSSVTYAGGGGGHSVTTGGAGGSGGGGAGGSGLNVSGTNGSANTGGGGGGANGGTSGAGGSGIVIIAYTATSPKFVGGTITTSGGKQIHTFTSSGTLTPLVPVPASYLVVAGGGGGGVNSACGGGAGGLLTSSTTLYSGATYVVTVGAGGAGGVSPTAGSTAGGANGSNSVLSGTGLTTVTAIGGGLGAGYTGQAGGNGGSGGGGNPGGTAVAGQGYDGGTGAYSAGGGAGGGQVVVSTGNNGGPGLASSISGTSTYYAGGGGGAGDYRWTPPSSGLGGIGGGGDGSAVRGGNAGSGTPNSGGGGGASSFSASGGPSQGNGGAGGSGIVIISYAGSQKFNGGLVTTSGGNTIHTFTSSGALTPLTTNLNNSLRFRGSNSAYLSRTPTIAGNRKTWTWSAWIKIGTISVNMGTLFIAQGQTAIYLNDGTYSSFRVNGAAGSDLITSMMPRDPSAWYHLVVACDTTQAVEANRLKIYVNGVQQTAFQAGSAYPTLNGDTYVNSTAAHYIGRRVWNSDQQYDGYMTDVYLIDGQALEPYYFGNNDANGVWKPIQYKGTYGTNGFYLTFGNTTSTTTLGYDSSPNGNNWTCNNISLTAGTTYDAMTDVPTNTSATVANYATLNPLNKDSGITVTQANLQATGSVGDVDRTIFSTMSIPSSQKIYFEVVAATGSSAGNYFAVGIAPSTLSLSALVGITGSFSIESNQATDSYKRISGTGTSYGAGTNFATNDIVQVAIDQANGKIWFGKNNTWFDSGNPSAGTNPATSTVSTSTEYFPAATFFRAGPTLAFNFGQRPFSYTPPSGFKALNTFNLPTPTILQGNKYMDATLYTGNGTTNVIVNQAQFKPDFVWVKNRAISEHNCLYDSVRGIYKQLYSNLTNAEDNATNSLLSFNSNGFTLGSNTTPNTNGNAHVGWQWQSGQGSTSTNTSGSITSTVSVNTTAGFSVVTFTAPASTGNFSVGHGLGVTPSMVITKRRDSASQWWVWHISLGNNTTDYLSLNTTNAEAALAGMWGSVGRTSTLLGYSDTSIVVNSTQVAYCWAEIAGFSKFGSYTGNGSTDGPFVYTGFRPKFILARDASVAGQEWTIYDTSRSTYNQAGNMLSPTLSAAETVWAGAYDILSNGFKLRTTDNRENRSGSTFIYAAFAEHPFKNANAR